MQTKQTQTRRASEGTYKLPSAVLAPEDGSRTVSLTGELLQARHPSKARTCVLGLIFTASGRLSSFLQVNEVSVK